MVDGYVCGSSEEGIDANAVNGDSIAGVIVTDRIRMREKIEIKVLIAGTLM
jgi:hypothetical protein